MQKERRAVKDRDVAVRRARAVEALVHQRHRILLRLRQLVQPPKVDTQPPAGALARLVVLRRDYCLVDRVRRLSDRLERAVLEPLERLRLDDLLLVHAIATSMDLNLRRVGVRLENDRVHERRNRWRSLRRLGRLL